jgi:hypothetical protein
MYRRAGRNRWNDFRRPFSKRHCLQHAKGAILKPPILVTMLVAAMLAGLGLIFFVM